MKQFVSKIWNSPSARNVGKLLSANVFAQALGLLVYPILTRMYSPEDFGLLNWFISIGGVFALLGTLDYFNAIVLPKTDQEARGIVHVSLMSIVIVTFLLLLTIPFAAPISTLLKSPRLTPYYWLLPVYVFLVSLWNVLNYWYIRHKEYGRISGYQMSQSLFSSGYKISFGAIGWLQGGLLLSTVLAPFCSLLVSICLSMRKHFRFLMTWDGEACRNAAIKYINFPKYSAPRSLLNYISGNLPTLMLTPVFGLTELGYVGMAFTLAFYPVRIIVQSVYQVFYQQVTEMVNRQQTIFGLLVRYVGWTMAVSAPLLIILYAILPWLTAWLLGDSWRITGDYIRLLLPWIIMVFLNTSINFIPDIFGKQRILLGMEICYLIFRILSLLIGIQAESIILALKLFSISGVIVLLVELVWFMSLARKHDKQYEHTNTIK